MIRSQILMKAICGQMRRCGPAGAAQQGPPMVTDQPTHRSFTTSLPTTKVAVKDAQRIQKYMKLTSGGRKYVNRLDVADSRT